MGAFPFLFVRGIIRGTCDRRCTDHGVHLRLNEFPTAETYCQLAFDRTPTTYAFIHLAIKRGVELQWKCFREFSYLSRRRRSRWLRVKKFIGNCSPSSMGKCWPIFFLFFPRAPSINARIPRILSLYNFHLFIPQIVTVISLYFFLRRNELFRCDNPRWRSIVIIIITNFSRVSGTG